MNLHFSSFLLSKLIIVVIFILSDSFLVHSQDKNLRIVFWNVENLFDTQDDTLTMDNEFLPEGDRRWDNRKFYQKLNNIYKVIIGIGEWNPPGIIGLCEIENRFVLNQLIYETPLKNFDYRIVHFESPDRRGIDVAMLYRKSYFTPDTSFPISIRFPYDTASRTRDILYVKGRIITGDTLHIFVNHWPSRYGGYLETQPKRNFAADILKSKIDSLTVFNTAPNIIILGDFNDDPTDASLVDHLGSLPDTSLKSTRALYNLMAIGSSYDDEGTLKYHDSWNVFDQVIISGNLIWGNQTLLIKTGGAKIYQAEFLFEQDEKYLGRKPFRTYRGFKYNGGFSDHLPVYIDLILSEN